MEIRTGLAIEDTALHQLCVRHGVKRLALFGSALRDTFNANSDIDILVEFIDGHSVGFLEIAEFELELGELLSKREVEIRTLQDLSPFFRDQVRKESRELYAA